ncbi:hypothetical protein PV764_16190 [Stenotrophomonas sp. AS1]
MTGTDTAAEGGDVPERGGRRCREQQHMVRSACVAVKRGLGDVQRRVTHATACCVGRTAALPAPHSPGDRQQPADIERNYSKRYKIVRFSVTNCSTPGDDISPTSSGFVY